MEHAMAMHGKAHIAGAEGAESDCGRSGHAAHPVDPA
jgi:hypothetical protein